MNEEIAWLRIQDIQREAESRRMLAGARSSTTKTLLKRLVARYVSARGRSTEPRQELA